MSSILEALDTMYEGCGSKKSCSEGCGKKSMDEACGKKKAMDEGCGKGKVKCESGCKGSKCESATNTVDTLEGILA